MSRREEIIPLLAEVFRTQGYEGASLSRLGEASGLGKGSLYNFFPGGKEEMAAAAVLLLPSQGRGTYPPGCTAAGSSSCLRINQRPKKETIS